MRAEDERRLEAIVVDRSASLRRAAYLLCGDVHAADDLVQRALLKLVVAWPLRNEAAVDTWLTRTLVRCFIDDTRRPWWRREHSAAEVPDRPAATAAESASDVAALLAVLPVRQRACVVLRYLDDLSVEQTAVAMGCSVGTVKSYTARALTRLRTELGLEPIHLDELSHGG
jgi:RNA polymerase sigma-70 factor (sigma-E family)